jgi:hypothetical protein
MANDEMHMIKEDRWLPSLWGDDVSTAKEQTTSAHHHQKLKLYFYYGHSDYWVDSTLRDALIAQRSKRSDASQAGNLPSMKISEHPEIPHTFSLDDRHMRIVAEEVAGYLGEIRQRVFA